MQGWIGKGQATERASYGKDKPGKGRSAVAVRRQETIWNLLQEMDSKGNPYCGSYSGSYYFKLLSNASGGIYPRAR